ncbi:multifunctional tRNA nucleotidyl transferase/2'3'-cyclic phosphodiesterase/2'nucleotidase/phosphatase, partial [mine drainage metagenome]
MRWRDCSPTVDALYGVPQRAEYHPEIDSGAHLELVLDMAAWLAPDNDRVGFAALTHDLGKALTPRAEWPRHVGHEQRGLAPLRALCARLRIGAEHADLAAAACRYHLDAHRALELRPGHAAAIAGKTTTRCAVRSVCTNSCWSAKPMRAGAWARTPRHIRRPRARAPRWRPRKASAPRRCWRKACRVRRWARRCAPRAAARSSPRARRRTRRMPAMAERRADDVAPRAAHAPGHAPRVQHVRASGMASDTPRVSVLMVLADSGDGALDAARRALAAPECAELIVLDNASRDGIAQR